MMVGGGVNESKPSAGYVHSSSEAGGQNPPEH